jgi:hypothetical protein
MNYIDRVAAARIGVDDEKRDHAIDPDRVIKDPAEIDQGNMDHFISQKYSKKSFNNST